MTADSRAMPIEELEWRLRDMTRQRNEALQGQRNERETVKQLRLILRGMTDEHFHLRVSVNPEIFDSKIVDAIQTLLQNYVGATVHSIEQKLGGPLRRLQEAVMHISYLENHARNCGVSFTQCEVSEYDRKLYYYRPTHDQTHARAGGGAAEAL